MEKLNELLQQLPGEGLLVAIFGILIGVTVWIAGRRILRPGFTAVGVLFGAGVGWVIASSINVAIPHWVFALAGAIVLGGVSWAAYRGAMGVLLAVLFAIAAPLGVWTWADHRGMDTFEVAEAEPAELGEEATGGTALDEADSVLDDTRDLLDQLRDRNDQLTDDVIRQLEEFRDGGGEPGDEGEGVVAEDADDAEGETGIGDLLGGLELPEGWLAEFDAFVRDVLDSVIEQWKTAPSGLRWSLSISALCGAVFGLLIGLAAPTLGATAVTALSGSALWMTCGWALAGRYGVAEQPWVPDSAGTWLALWLAVSIIGAGIQWTFRRKPADKSG